MSIRGFENVNASYHEIGEVGDVYKPVHIKQKSYLNSYVPNMESCEQIYNCLMKKEINNPIEWSFDDLFCLLEWCMIGQIRVKTETCLLSLLIDKAFNLRSCYSIILMGMEYDHEQLEICSKEPKYSKELVAKMAIEHYLKTLTSSTQTIVSSLPQILGALMCIEGYGSITKFIANVCAENMRKIDGLERLDLNLTLGLLNKAASDIKSKIEMKNDAIYDGQYSTSKSLKKMNSLINFTGEPYIIEVAIISTKELARWAAKGLFPESDFGTSVGHFNPSLNIVCGAFFKKRLVAFAQARKGPEDIKYVGFVEAAIPGRSLGPLALLGLMAIINEEKWSTVVELQNAAAIGRRHVYSKLGFRAQDPDSDDEDDPGMMEIAKLNKKFADNNPYMEHTIEELGTGKIEISEYDIMGHLIEMAKKPSPKLPNKMLYNNIMELLLDKKFNEEFPYETDDMQLKIGDASRDKKRMRNI
jgi:hypothetical protein